MPVTVFAKGKLPVNEENFSRALKLSSYTAAAEVEYPDVDYSGEYAHWADTLDGNDRAGDCVAVGIANTERLDAAVLDDNPNLAITLEQVIALYKIFNPGFDFEGSPSTNGPGSNDDNGCVIQDVLEWLVKNGFPIGPDGQKLAGFVKVDHTDMEMLRSAISLGGSVLVGGLVTDSQQKQFPTTAWTWDAKGKNGGGHCFLLAGFQRAKKLFTGVCWASAFPITEGYLVKALDEAWLLIWPSMLKDKTFTDGMDVATFAADVSAATHQPFPVDITPGPVVTPPAPSDPPVDTPPVIPPLVVPIPKISEPGRDAVLTDGTFTIDGEGEPGLGITVHDGITELGATIADASLGTWELEVTLEPGVHQLWATATDADGNVSSSSVQIPVTVLEPAPEPEPEPTDPDEIFARFLKRHIIDQHRVDYQTRFELRQHAERWLAARDL